MKGKAGWQCCQERSLALSDLASRRFMLFTQVEESCNPQSNPARQGHARSLA